MNRLILLLSLLGACGPSKNEREVRDFIIDRLSSWVQRIKQGERLSDIELKSCRAYCNPDWLRSHKVARSIFDEIQAECMRDMPILEGSAVPPSSHHDGTKE